MPAGLARLPPQTNQVVDVRDFLQFAEQHLSDPIDEVLDAVECLRASGYKTALLVNNWKRGNGKTFLPLPTELFDVVRLWDWAIGLVVQ